MDFEDLVEGYEDRPIVGSLVAMWRQATYGLTAADALRVLCIVFAAYVVMWASCMWASL